MTDLVTRLLLNSSQFDNNIIKSTQQVQNLQKQGRQASESVSKFASTLTGVASACGIAVGSVEIFNGLMEGSQTFGDAATTSIAGVKGSVDEFFYSLGTGDFSSFLNGMDEIILKARQSAIALDQLGNTQMSYKFFSGRYDADMADAKAVLADKNATKVERAAAEKLLKQALSEKAAAAETLKRDNLKAAQALATQGTSLKNVSVKDIEYTARIDLLPESEREKAKAKYARDYKAYRAEVNEITRRYNVQLAGTNNIGQIESIKLDKQDALNQAAERHRKGIIVNNLLVKKSDENWQKVLDTVSNVDTINKQIANDTKAANRAIKGDTTTTTSTKVPNKIKELSPEQSIAYYQQELSKANKEFNSAVSDSARAAIQAKIEQLKEVISVMEFKANHSKLPRMKEENGSMSGHTSLKVKGNPTAGLNIKSIDTSKQMKNNVTYTNEWADSLSAVAQIMGNITQNTNSSATAYISYAGNVISATAGMLTAIKAATEADRQARLVKEGKLAIDAADSAAQTPLVGWLLVGAAIAGVLASIASVPKYANGGIISSSSSIGDMSIARVNSGEMILNGRQQANLFNLLNSGAQETSSIKPQESKVVIRGSDIYLALKAYSSKVSRINGTGIKF